MIETCTDGLEASVRRVRLLQEIATPALDRAIGTDPTCMSPTCTDIGEFSRRGSGATVTVVVTTPTCGSAVGADPTGVVEARGDCAESAFRCAGLSYAVVSPAFDRVVRADPAGMIAAGRDACELAVRCFGLTVEVATPAVEIAVDVESACVIATRGDLRPIAQRSAAVEDRSEAGHWEGDLIIGANNRSAVATLVERFSRQTLAVSLPDGYDAQSTAAAVSAALRRQPRHLVKTLTWDQGREMARWQDIEAATGAEYRPRSPVAADSGLPSTVSAACRLANSADVAHPTRLSDCPVHPVVVQRASVIMAR